MPIHGHGIDLVDVARIAAMIERHGETALARCFTAAERDYCDRQSRRRMEHYAARFAAKEAVLKALGTGWAKGIGWTDVEVRRDPAGRPTVQLHGRAAAIAAEQGIAAWQLSLSHTATQAIASAIAIGA
jgi:holo-[acyl-carrier protein] synthase